MKKFLLLATLLVASASAWAAHVDLAMAKATAQKFANVKSVKTNFSGSSATEVKLLHAEMNSSLADQAVYYIFNAPQGFIIVSGDDRAHDILAYGDKPLDMKHIPDNMKFWLSTYKAQIEYLQAHPGMVVEKPATGKDKSLRIATVEPMLTALWDQSSPYYKYCKFDNYQCVTGCPATSLSMVFYYWKYPTDPTPEVEGYTNQASGYSFNIPELPSITFDWDNMLDTYTYGNYSTEQADAVAWLMRYIGQEEQMEYSPGGSGAMGEDILRAVKFFGYDEDAQLVFKAISDDYGNETELINDEDWAIMLQNEMAEGRPVVYCAYDYSSWFGWSGHAFNVDGYNANTNTYHVNWGWSGDGNGDFALNAFNGGGSVYNIEQQMIMGIKPPLQGPGIKVSPSKLSMEAFVDKSATATIKVKGNELTDDITLTLNDETGFFSIDANSVAVSDQENGKVITVTYAPLTVGEHVATITLSSPGVEDVICTINGVATLETFVPVMLPADTAHINLTKFRADWTDQTDSKYVDSYTLEVSDKPAAALIFEADFSGLPSGYNEASHATDYLPEGWSFSGNSFWLDGACISVGYNGIITTSPIDLTGYDQVTVVLKAKNDSEYSSTADMTISTSLDSENKSFSAYYEDYVYILNCSSTENIVFTNGYYYTDIESIRIYGGDATELLSSKAAVKNDNEFHLLIPGITDKYYDVTGLEAGGTFYYKVKALYTDGTESKWSRSQFVTLFDNGPEFQKGDLNHDGSIDVTDVTMLINYVLNDDEYTDEADMDGNGDLDVSDVTMLISYVLSN